MVLQWLHANIIIVPDELNLFHQYNILYSCPGGKLSLFSNNLSADVVNDRWDDKYMYLCKVKGWRWLTTPQLLEILFCYDCILPRDSFYHEQPTSIFTSMCMEKKFTKKCR